MSIQARLDQLFEQWKEVHKQKADMLNLQYPERFLPDGIAGDEAAYEKSSPKVLYILKESNVGDRCDDLSFWFKAQATGGGTHRITKRIRLMQKVITGSDDLTAVAYMNLNKSGGTSATNGAKLEAYVLNENISSFIKEEIRILNPDIIVCGGCFDTVTKLLKSDTPVKIINIWHPSYYFVSNKKYQVYKSTERLKCGYTQLQKFFFIIFNKTFCFL